MRIDFMTTSSLEKGLAIIETLTKGYLLKHRRRQEVSLEEALGKVIAEEVISPVTLPEFNRSTVDGYAVVSSDLNSAGENNPIQLKLSGETEMGTGTDGSVISGQCHYVPTGGMIPAGANAMVMIEYTELLSEGDVRFYHASATGDNISYRGDDIKAGEKVIDAGKTLTSFDIALLAGMGIGTIEIYAPPVFHVISTGDEIVDLNEPCNEGQVRDINTYGIKSWVRQHGGIVSGSAIVRDQEEALRASVEKGLVNGDVVILSGGSSMGVRDYTKEIIESFEEGKIHLHGLAVKPGKPTIIGTVGKKLVIGLPGHPVSALMVCDHLGSVLMDTWYGRLGKRASIPATLTNDIHETPGRDRFQLVKLIETKEGVLASPIYGKSGLISTLAKASGWVRVSVGSAGYKEGQMVQVTLLQDVRF